MHGTGRVQFFEAKNFFPLTIKKQNFASPSHFFQPKRNFFILFKKMIMAFFLFILWFINPKMEHLAESFSSTNTAEHNYATSSAHL